MTFKCPSKSSKVGTIESAGKSDNASPEIREISPVGTKRTKAEMIYETGSLRFDSCLKERSNG